MGRTEGSNLGHFAPGMLGMVLLFKHGLQERMIFLMIPCILNVNLDHIFINFFIRISVTFYLPKKGMKRIYVAFFEFL